MRDQWSSLALLKSGYLRYTLHPPGYWVTLVDHLFPRAPSILFMQIQNEHFLITQMTMSYLWCWITSDEACQH